MQKLVKKYWFQSRFHVNQVIFSSILYIILIQKEVAYADWLWPEKKELCWVF